MSDSVISASIVRSPRRAWKCDSCGQPIGRAPHMRLFGAAHSDEKPYRIRICLGCADGCSGTSKRIAAALAGERAAAPREGGQP